MKPLQMPDHVYSTMCAAEHGSFLYLPFIVLFLGNKPLLSPLFYSLVARVIEYILKKRLLLQLVYTPTIWGTDLRPRKK